VVAGLPAALQGMQANRYDAFNGPVEATAEREQQFDTITWMTTRAAYVFPAEDVTQRQGGNKYVTQTEAQGAARCRSSTRPPHGERTFDGTPLV